MQKWHAGQTSPQVPPLAPMTENEVNFMPLRCSAESTIQISFCPFSSFSVGAGISHPVMSMIADLAPEHVCILSSCYFFCLMSLASCSVPAG